ncbi:histone-lysine N-methyltransferase NSD2-like, partial [Mercenaria mercenaria]|uniref:histone-lysine N-methyltransferase NSD2-like n=1 Tax=Mercenaria mercenaria TaxID=6596 RepID=UPI00234EF8FC
MKTRKTKEQILQGLLQGDPIFSRKAKCEDADIGWGLFTDVCFNIGEYICEYKGEVIDHEEANRRGHTAYQFSFEHHGQMLCIDAYHQSTAGIARYANDEWQKPNSRVVKEVVNGEPHLFLKCIRPITVGMEIRYNYNNKDAFWRTSKKVTVMPFFQVTVMSFLHLLVKGNKHL